MLDSLKYFSSEDDYRHKDEDEIILKQPVMPDERLIAAEAQTARKTSTSIL